MSLKCSSSTIIVIPAHFVLCLSRKTARNIILFELNSTFNAGGSNGVNFNHISLLVDFMTHSGDITSIDRHGLSKLDIDPMSKASFEKTMEHFVNAAIFNESDKLSSVSSKIMVGQVIPGGTGSFSLKMDTEKIWKKYLKNIS